MFEGNFHFLKQENVMRLGLWAAFLGQSSVDSSLDISTSFGSY